MSDEAHFKPLVKFDRDTLDFVLGYEAGMLFARLDGRKPKKWSGTYHVENRTMLQKTADACGYSVKVEESPDPSWIFATFTLYGKN